MTIYRRSNGSWAGTFTYRGQRHWIGTHPTKRAAKAAEAALRREVEGLSPETFEGWAQRWETDYARPKESTRKVYKYAVKQLVKEFGSRQIASVDRAEARALSQKLPYNVLRTARLMFNDAIDAGLVQTNPFSNLRLEQSRGRKDLDALREEEIVSLADAAMKAYDDGYGAVMRAWILVSAYTGIRPAESFALEWKDISGDELIVQGTKTQTAYRKIFLPPIARSALAEMPRYFDSPFVFVSKRGKQFSKSILYYNFSKVRIAYGDPSIDPYDLRHAAGTNLMLRGAEPWAIARQLGHNDHGRLVMELYGHPSEKDARQRIRGLYAENVSPLAAKLQQRRSKSAQ